MTQPADMLPFRSEFGESMNVAALAARNRAGAGEALLAALLKDPHLAALDRDLRFADVVRDAQTGTFDRRRFLDRGRGAVAGYLRRSRTELAAVFSRDAAIDVLLQQKLTTISNPLSAPVRRTRTPPPLTPSRQVRELFRPYADVLRLTPVCDATVLHSNQEPGGRPRYAWRISTPADAPSDSAGTARCEFGRAVFVNDVDVDPVSGAIRSAGPEPRPAHIRTQLVLKGVGRTRFADNRFSRRASGHLTWLQGDRDWRYSETLARGGVPVYRSLELSLLPYCTWHPSMGWQPIVVYARLPLENLRISDLDLLSARKVRAVVGALRTKLAALNAAEPADITTDDLVTFFVARLGRVAGLFESGRTFAGRPFFHGFLHPQNVSLLGEIVDLGEGQFVDRSGELRAAYASSGYVNPQRNWRRGVRRARQEVVLFHDLVHHFGRHMMSATAAPAARPSSIDALFWGSYRQGRAGNRADDVGDLLRRRPRRSRPR